MRKPLLCLFVLIGFFFTASAQSNINVKGILTDRATGERLIGATVATTGAAASTGLDGSFSLHLHKTGSYIFRCSYIGYRSIDTTINVAGNMRMVIRLNSAASELKIVNIAGRRDRESEASAKTDEKNAPQVLNVVSAKTIQLSPDIIVANVLQRVSGVSIERSSSGDGRYAIIRGMNQRYSYTLVNGIKIPTTDPKNRYVPLDIFPAELVERIEVSKTLTPNMEGDAVGGVVNLVMKNAPDKLYVNASLSTGYSQNLFNTPFKYFPVSAINKQSPYMANGPLYQAKPSDFTRDNLNFTNKNFTPNTLASLSIGNRFFDKKLGVMIGGSYQDTYKGYTSIFSPADPVDQTGGDKQLAIQIKHANFRTYSTHLTRVGLNGKVDYQLAPGQKLSLNGFYAMLDEAQSRLTTDTIQTGINARPTVGLGQVWYYGRSTYQRQTVGSASLQGEHRILSDLKFDWTGAYSKATNNAPDWAEYEYDGGYYADSNNPTPYTHPGVLQNYNRIWERTNDRDLSGYANLAYNNHIGDIPFTITAGGMYRDKDRDNSYQNYELRPVQTSSSPQVWTNIYDFQWTVFNPDGSPGNANTYTATEKITAGYGMLKFNVNKLETIIGARVENTEQSFVTQLPPTIAGKTGNISYSDMMPSAHFKYALNDKANLRLSYFASINRPSFFELLPVGDGHQDADFTVQGNPYLKHATADNFDLRYELFPGGSEQLLLGAFYKHLNNAIEYGFTDKTSDTYTPQNFGDAVNYGLEFVFEKYIRKFGFRANYTYTNSSITTVKKTTVDATAGTVNQTRPLQGQSAHVANAALLYKDTKNGLDLQLAWQYTGSRISLVSSYYNFDEWQKPLSMFDFSAEKKFAKRFSVFAKVQNLLNTADEFYFKKTVVNPVPVSYQTPGSATTLSHRNQYGQNYQLGLRYILN
ncbi:TonB-dependent receptor [Mucilaginibacter yixingensis]|uniref:TonB-dependent receptor n=1 Tax=Mucilaginibacter yixingensis TaxID=1295612 RepID=A0A2T5JBD3_9SPHI|nr:TonB-dependent receptor [Mucilaginibacter yixingensis]PTQ98178.1 TonB-dependent receptor [Mucilaginibacter yixingensis]